MSGFTVRETRKCGLNIKCNLMLGVGIMLKFGRVSVTVPI